MDDETLYRQLSLLADSVPAFRISNSFPTYSPEIHKWLGRLEALVEIGDKDGLAKLRAAIAELSHTFMSNRTEAVNTIMATLFRSLARVEIRAPESLTGSFIAVGSSYDAVRALSDIMKKAESRIVIVDPYMDESALSDAAIFAEEGVRISLLSDSSTVKSSLKPMVIAWQAQYGALRPVEAKLAPARALHDRLILIDDSIAWILTQSIKDLAKRSPATLTSVGPETAGLKIPAYEAIWAGSAPL